MKIPMRATCVSLLLAGCTLSIHAAVHPSTPWAAELLSSPDAASARVRLGVSATNSLVDDDLRASFAWVPAWMTTNDLTALHTSVSAASGGGENYHGWSAIWTTNGLPEFNAVRLPPLVQTGGQTYDYTHVFVGVGDIVETGTYDTLTNSIVVTAERLASTTTGDHVVLLGQTVDPSALDADGDGRMALAVVIAAPSAGQPKWLYRPGGTPRVANWYGTRANYRNTNIVADCWANVTTATSDYVPFELVTVETNQGYFKLSDAAAPPLATNAVTDITNLEARLAVQEGLFDYTSVAACMPPIVFGVAGRQMAFYWTGMATDPTEYIWHAEMSGTSTGARQYTDGWLWTPSAPSTNSLSVEVWLRRQAAWNPYTTASGEVRVVDDDQSGAVTLLVIGDSTVGYNDLLTGSLLNIWSTNGASWTLDLIGTQGDGSATNLHEGYSGWAAHYFRTNDTSYMPPPGASPFIFPSGDTAGQPDFTTYLSTNGLATPTHALIKLGINRVVANHASYDALLAKIAQEIEDTEALIDALQRDVPGIRIGVCLTTPGTYDPAGWSPANLGDREGHYRGVRCAIESYPYYIAAFGGRAVEGVDLVALNTAIDATYGYPRETAARNAHTSEERTYADNNVHPDRDGAFGVVQTAEVVYAWLAWTLSE